MVLIIQNNTYQIQKCTSTNNSMHCYKFHPSDITYNKHNYVGRVASVASLAATQSI